MGACPPTRPRSRVPEGPLPLLDRRARRGRGLARRWAAAVWDPTPASMRSIALAGVISTAGIIVTGAAVRLSESGLGCPDWPECTRSSLVGRALGGDPHVPYLDRVRQPDGDRRDHRRRRGGAGRGVAVPSRRPGARRRPDLVWLAAVQPAGVVAQAVLGGIVVLTKLNPALVSLHFLASIAILAAAVALHVTVHRGHWRRRDRWSAPTCACWPAAWWR